MGCCRIVERAARALVRCPNNYSGSQVGGMCTLASRGLPVLMLPSSFGGGVLKAYSVAEEKVISINRAAGGEDESGVEESTVVGSSHGWVALFNKEWFEGDLFLWHPLSGRQVKLPPMKTLPDAYPAYNYGRAVVSKVILSCSPDDEECRAMMIYGTVGMAHCRPCHSPEWTDPIEGEIVLYPDGKDYLDIVYSSSQKLFFCITDRDELEAWDLLSGSSTSPVRVDSLKYEDEESTEEEDEDEEEENLEMVKYLVLDQEWGQFLVVTRHVLGKLTGGNRNPMYIYKTTGFDVHRVDGEKGRLRYMNPAAGALGGLSIFIGNNHSLALKSPQLNPNSIYFTDQNASLHHSRHNTGYFCDDIGVFNYQTTTFSPCYYNPPHTPLSTIIPPPFWCFT